MLLFLLPAIKAELEEVAQVLCAMVVDFLVLIVLALTLVGLVLLLVRGDSLCVEAIGLDDVTGFRWPFLPLFAFYDEWNLIGTILSYYYELFLIIFFCS